MAECCKIAISHDAAKRDWASFTRTTMQTERAAQDLSAMNAVEAEGVPSAGPSLSMAGEKERAQ
ncbi:MAG: hypothetical protein R3C51_01000 [Parvularculaceae bacterium]